MRNVQLTKVLSHFSINEKFDFICNQDFEHVATHARFYTMIIKSNALPGFQNRICQGLKNLYLKDLFPAERNAQRNEALFASYHSYAIFGMIMEWVDGGLTYSPSYMAEQLLNILHFSPPQPIHMNKASSGTLKKEE
ncbi:TetR-like C-terminal domain-containing protein [Brevibacillus choshinensis]|uniref:TetR-like C-terminal domain-containing protein n=1 Tax=Brevibacillus choshinensis TaxID=54911 RepID=UPI002E217846|nr:TetR-like C-terminal domain-containing protein [Brevibacillus choshinensis]